MFYTEELARDFSRAENAAFQVSMIILILQVCNSFNFFFTEKRAKVITLLILAGALGTYSYLQIMTMVRCHIGVVFCSKT
jgi:Tfp pilus assembly PilM family ATPase